MRAVDRPVPVDEEAGICACAGRANRWTQLLALTPAASSVWPSDSILPQKISLCSGAGTSATSAILALSAATVTVGDSRSILCSRP